MFGLLPLQKAANKGNKPTPFGCFFKQLTNGNDIIDVSNSSSCGWNYIFQEVRKAPLLHRVITSEDAKKLSTKEVQFIIEKLDLDLTILDCWGRTALVVAISSPNCNCSLINLTLGNDENGNWQGLNSSNERKSPAEIIDNMG